MRTSEEETIRANDRIETRREETSSKTKGENA